MTMNTITVDSKIYDEIAAYARLKNVSVNDAAAVGLRTFLNNINAKKDRPKKEYYISSAVRALETDFKCPDDLSYDYKKEINSDRESKYL